MVTCLDGHAMAKQGRAGAALGIAAFGSFIAGTLGLVGLMLFAAPLSRFGLRFGPPEYFGIILLGLILVVYLSQASILRSLIMAGVGLILSCVGIDRITGSPRMTFDMLELWNGIDMVSLGMGLFGISEILITLEESADPEILQDQDQESPAHTGGLAAVQGPHPQRVRPRLLPGHPAGRGGGHRVVSLLRD